MKRGYDNMKAKVEINNKSDIILSIGMIVKNEEKVLGRCLESLKPLMAAIPSELIIADTGSTDRTVEIAKKYTENVFNFEWINDFAAARNSTLKKAKGQWYLFVDADEYLDDDISEIINFFNIPELRNKYKTLEINVRSYCDEEKKNYGDAYLARFQRINDPNEPVEFIGSVHESMYIRYPLGYFSTILHHTGYVYSSQIQNQKKKKRNMTLMMEEYKKNPEDLRLLCHMIDGTVIGSAEREKYADKAIKIARKEKTNLYARIAFVLAIECYQNFKPEYSLDLCKEYYDTMPNTDKAIATVGVLCNEAKILAALARYEEAYDVYLKYFDMYEKSEKEELDITDSSTHPIPGASKNEYLANIYQAALVLKNLKRYDEAFAILDKFDIFDINDEKYREYLGTLREICKDKKDYSKLAAYYGKVSKTDDQNRKILALYMMESSYYSLYSLDERNDFARDITGCGLDNKYTELMQLVLDQQDSDEFRNKLEKFIKKVDDWTDGYLEAIYLAIKYKLDISYAVDKIKCSEMRAKLEKIGSSNDDFSNIVLAYGVPESYTQSIKRFFWITSMYEKASYYTFNISDDDKYPLIQRFTSLLGDYVLNIYNEELLNDTDVEVLEPLHRFGYYMYKANSALLSGDKVSYIRELKKALINCESMKEIVKFLMEMFKKENNM